MRVLFVCVENACRSQMAEAFARGMGGEEVEAASAGSRPSGEVNPRAVSFMEEVGYDLGSHRSKGVEAIPDGAWDLLVSMGCGDDCPSVEAGERLEWDVEDPADLPDDGFRRVRDEVQARVRALLRARADR